MKINSISLRDWMSHAETDFALDRLNLIVGRNGQGKSAILDGIRQTLLGYCPRSPKRGLTELDRGTVALDVEGIGPVTRQVDPNGLQVGTWSGGVTAQQDALLAALHISGPALDAALSSYQFHKLDPAGQKEMIFGLLDVGFTPAEVRKLISDYTGNPATICDLLDSRLFDFSKAGPEVFSALHADAFEKRKAAKRTLKAAEAAPIPRPPVLPAGITAADLPDAEAQLAEVKAERDGLLRRAGEARAVGAQRARLAELRDVSFKDRIHPEVNIADLPALTDLHAVLLGRREELTARLGEVRGAAGQREVMADIDVRIAASEKSVAEANAAMDGDAYAAMEKRKDALEAEIGKLRADRKAATDKLAEAKVKEGEERERLAAIEKFGGACVLHASIKCPMAPADLAKLKVSAKGKLSRAEASASEAEAALKEIGEKADTAGQEHRATCEAMNAQVNAKTAWARNVEALNVLRDQKAKMEDRHGGAQLAVNPETVEAELSGVKAEIVNAENDFEMIREEKAHAERVARHAKEVADLEAQVKAMPDAGAVEAELAAAEKRIASGASLIGLLREAARAEAEAVKVKAARAEAKSRVESLEFLVAALAPSGIPREILASKLDPIKSRANEMLGILTGGEYQVELATDPDFEVMVAHGGRTLPLFRLSHSEQLRIGIVLQDALCRLTGLRFLAIDDAEMLDPAGRAFLSDFLQAVLFDRDEYDQAVVIRTLTESDAAGNVVVPVMEPMEGVRLFLVEAGVVSDITPAARPELKLVEV